MRRTTEKTTARLRHRLSPELLANEESYMAMRDELFSRSSNFATCWPIRYWVVDHKIVWGIVQTDLPRLLETARRLLATETD